MYIMTELNDYKNELREIIEFALMGYDNFSRMKSEKDDIDSISEIFDSLVVEISVVTANNNRMYMRRYDVKTSQDESVMSFIWDMPVCFFQLLQKNSEKN